MFIYSPENVVIPINTKNYINTDQFEWIEDKQKLLRKKINVA